MFTPGLSLTLHTSFTQTDFNRFASLSGDNNPIHIDPDFSARTKFGKPVAHGMLLYSFISRGLTTLLPGTIQLVQELMFPAPTFADEEIRLEIVVTTTQDQESCELTTNIYKINGQECCRGRAVVSTDAFIDPKTINPEADQSPDANQSKVGEMRGLKLGQSATIKKVFTPMDIDRYVKLGGDTNPLYSDYNFVRSFGLERPIIPGPLLGSLFSNLLGTRLPGRGTNWLKQKLAFKTPAHPALNFDDKESEISAWVEVTRLRPEKDLVNLRTYCTNIFGKILCDGEALVLVSDMSVER
jgi:acyl dehydratase